MSKISKNRLVGAHEREAERKKKIYPNITRDLVCTGTLNTYLNARYGLRLT